MGEKNSSGPGPHKIAAIKALREETRCGLKEAKDFVEWYFRDDVSGNL